ncbi:hypothetical protein [Corynebacterium epidermidicanis]|uniref:Uncharacterized protein n=1 Tax=Corynebacterium epidermidicanis TaxID=1050174 RepID=A0A0G3GPH8_9CORY|nr:hypothetical protein [Corynebacterium epidermidicanis]AKK03074.1 hypothetical protein CEPID_06065 [Corynebacterium epidermidicanis]
MPKIRLSKLAQALFLATVKRDHKNYWTIRNAIPADAEPTINLLLCRELPNLDYFMAPNLTPQETEARATKVSGATEQRLTQLERMED